MARTPITTYEYTDDLDGTEVPTADDLTAVLLSIDGYTVEIDLSDPNLKDFREKFAPYLRAGRVMPNSRIPKAAGMPEWAKLETEPVPAPEPPQAENPVKVENPAGNGQGGESPAAPQAPEGSGQAEDDDAPIPDKWKPYAPREGETSKDADQKARHWWKAARGTPLSARLPNAVKAEWRDFYELKKWPPIS